MADNIQLNPGVGGSNLASDDIGGVQHQRVKVGWGEDGSFIDANETRPLPVAVESPATPYGELITVSPYPAVQANFMYGLLSEVVLTEDENGGSVGVANSVATLNTSTDADGRAVVTD